MIKAGFTGFLKKNSGILKKLYDKKIFLITGFEKGGLIQDTDPEKCGTFLHDSEDLEILQKLVESSFFTDYAYPVVVDAAKAVGLYKKSGAAGYKREEEALLLSRFSFMGTDGMRGKVAPAVEADCIKDFVAHNLLTPEMIRLASYSYGRMLLENHLIKEGDRACVGSDGRDKAAGGILHKAMTEAFLSCSLEVEDLGTIPTPFVPYRMVQQGISCGAMLTASHNPANQNGIKFFLDGKKNLPEGLTGDYSLAGWMYDSFLRDLIPAAKGETLNVDISGEAADFMTALAGKQEDIFLVLDTANGAFTDLSLKVLNDLKLPYVCVNEKPTGDNINKGCGVAEVEGTEHFAASGYQGYIKAVKEVFDRGRQGKEGKEGKEKVFGFILDGDGDRGLLLFYNAADDSVVTLDGDKCAFLLARYLLHSGTEKKSELKNSAFVTTVESDLMAAYYAQHNLNLSAFVVSVGDKWICTFDKTPLLVGTEASGHLIVPLDVTTKEGTQVELRSGNGLVTCLLTLKAIGELDLEPGAICEPYEAGFSRTFYTYFVDKSLFFKGSTIWNYDQELIRTEFAKLREKGLIAQDMELVFEEKEDPHMLYASFIQDKIRVGALFCRNSGTEDKTAVYVKCKKEQAKAFLQIGTAIRDYHRSVMKNKSRIEYRFEEAIGEIVQEKKEISLEQLTCEVKNRLDGAAGVTANSIHPVVYALKKEGRLVYEADLVKAL